VTKREPTAIPKLAPIGLGRLGALWITQIGFVQTLFAASAGNKFIVHNGYTKQYRSKGHGYLSEHPRADGRALLAEHKVDKCRPHVVEFVKAKLSYESSVPVGPLIHM
jgi:hypothetical protein